MIFSCHHNSILSPSFPFCCCFFFLLLVCKSRQHFGALWKNYNKIKAKFPFFFYIFRFINNEIRQSGIYLIRARPLGVFVFIMNSAIPLNLMRFSPFFYYWEFAEMKSLDCITNV